MEDYRNYDTFTLENYAVIKCFKICTDRKTPGYINREKKIS